MPKHILPKKFKGKGLVRTILASPSATFSPETFLIDPQQLNTYSYARDNPLTVIDPMGLFNIQTGAVEKGDTLFKITNLLNSFNSTNYNVSQLSGLNNIKDPNKIFVGQTLIPNGSIPDITKSLTETVQTNAANSSIKNPISFFNKVKTGGIWDYKDQSLSPYYAPTHKNGFVFEGEKVRTDFPGNFNYGYAGSSTWWGSKSILLRGAGGAQVLSDIKGFKLPLWNPPYFDNPGDSNEILQGINYYKNK